MKHFLIHKGDDFLCLIRSTSKESAVIKLHNISFDDWFRYMEDEGDGLSIDYVEYLYNERKSFQLSELPVIL